MRQPFRAFVSSLASQRLMFAVSSVLAFGLLLSGCGGGGNSSGAGGSNPTPTATPSFSPAAGTYTSAQNITLADATPGATIFYTTDGSTPTTASPKYTAAIALTTSGTTTLNAIATASGDTTSALASATYVLNIAATTPAATPTFSPAAGTFTTAQNITLADTTPGATIYYTTDNSTPTTSSAKYTAPIAVTTPGTTTINAIAVATGFANSAVASAAYVLNLPTPAPTFSPAAGTFTSAQNITLSDTTPGATIYYTTDNSTPTTSSAKYTAPIAVTTPGTTTINAIAVATGFANSAVASAAYVLNLPTPAPTFSPAAGSFTSAQNITLSDTLTGATIYYTLDGSTPTTSSSKYTAAIALTTSGTTKISAIAVATGYTNSPVATATYLLNLPAAPIPTFSPAPGSFTTAQSITLSDTLAGATIYYTTDSSTPTAASTKYTAPISLSNSATTTINAVAIATGYTTSPVASATYILTIAAGTPNYTYQNVQIVGGGFVDGLFFHPGSKGLMYARTDVGGAYRWNNVAGGDTQWVPLLDFVGRYQNGYNLGVESLGLDPNDPTRLYIATGEYTTSGDKDYIFTSADMGNTFKAVQLPFANGSNNNGRFAGERLSVDPANGKHIYFGTRVNGLYESIDQGATWNKITGFPVTGGTGTSFDPGVGIIFEDFLTTSGTANGNTKTIYYGVSDPTTNPATSQPTGATGLYVTNDGGQTFSSVAGQPTGFYLNAGVFDPSNRYLYLSYARQAHITGYQQSTPCTSSCVSVGPGNVNDGQIWRYTLPTTASPTGAWINVTPPLLSSETNSQYISNPYGFSGVTIDPSHPDTVMVTTLNKYYPPPFDDIFRSLDDGATWVDFGTNMKRDDTLSPWLNFGQATPDVGNWLNHPVIDPFNPDHLMYGDGQTIWQTTDATAVDGATTSTTSVTPGNATNWTIGAKGVEEAVILGLASPPSGPAHLFSVMYDLGGFTHTSLTQSQLQQMNPELTDGRGVDFAWQAPLIVARVGDNTQASGSSSASQIVGFSADGGVTWKPNTTLPTGVTQGQGSVAVSADGSTVLWLPIDPGVPASYTTDQGATWHASTGAPAQINQGYNRSLVVADRVNASKFYEFTFQSSASSNDGVGTVYVSTDGGHTFTAAAALTNSYPTGIFVSPAAEGDVWVTAYNGLFHSTNSGAAFTTVYSFNNPTYALGFGAAAAGQTYPAIYMIGQLANDSTCASSSSTDAAAWFTTATNCIYRSTDGGATFLHINDYAHQFSNASYIVGDPRVFGRYFLGTPGRGIIQADSPF